MPMCLCESEPVDRRSMKDAVSGATRAAVAALLLLAPVSATQAQVSGTVALATDDRFRGASVSDGDPVAQAEIDYDTSRGAYLGAAAAFRLGSEVGQLVNLSGSAGYALRVSPALSLDAGVTYSHYSEYGEDGRDAGYAELYLGAQARHLSAYLRYSPDYFGRSDKTIYAEVASSAQPAQGWLVSGHAGLLWRVKNRTEPQRDAIVDWSLSVTRQITGPVSAGLVFAGNNARPAYGVPNDHAQSSLAAILRVSL